MDSILLPYMEVSQSGDFFLLKIIEEFLFFSG